MDWFEAPLPWRWHQCRTQTCGVINSAFIERCACGAVRMNHGSWLERNSRRKR